MAKCIRCGTETYLFDSGIPICLRCEAKPQSDRERIAGVLRMKIETARIRQFVANKALDDIVHKMPSAIPAPDGTLRIREAERKYQQALKTIELAARSLNDFLLNGRVPPDLDLRKDSGKE